jgi:hypothetical protein
MSVAQHRNSIKVEGVVTVRQYGDGEYRWTRTPHEGSVSFRSSEIFTDEWSAWLTAVNIARAFNCALRVPAEIRERLMALYHQQQEEMVRV